MDFMKCMQAMEFEVSTAAYNRGPLSFLALIKASTPILMDSQKAIPLAPDDQFRDSFFGRLNFKTRPNVLKQLKFFNANLIMHLFSELIKSVAK